MKKNKFGGFTLIELLIVVAIISILMTIGINSFNKLQINARDAKRKSDLSIIQSALEQYHADQHFYPSCLKNPCSDLYVDSVLSLTSSTGNPSPPVSVKTYLSILSLDPLNTPPNIGVTPWHVYSYMPLPSDCTNNTGDICTSYCLYATAENNSNAGFTGDCDGRPYWNYAVTAP